MDFLLPPVTDLHTPVLRLDPAGSVVVANAAAARWLGVGLRRLEGVPAVALERDGHALADALAGDGPARLQRLAIAHPAQDQARFADVWLAAAGPDGRWLEAHPVAEFPGPDPAELLPAALTAALKGLAHELRNPLAGIKGAAQLLARRSDTEGRQLTALIEDEVGRLAYLVERLMDPAPARPFASVNIHAVLERVLRLAEAEAGWAVKLQRDFDPSLPELPGDADRLVQTIWNLVRNAIEAAAGAIVLRTRAAHGVRIGEHAWPLVLRLEIIDDGRGVPPELAETIFLPLVSGRAEGSGLGLALAQQVAREHRGSLAWRSRPGHTVFTLLLPIAGHDVGGDDA